MSVIDGLAYIYSVQSDYQDSLVSTQWQKTPYFKHFFMIVGKPNYLTNIYVWIAGYRIDRFLLILLWGFWHVPSKKNRKRRPILFYDFMSFIILYLQEWRTLRFYAFIFIQYNLFFCSNIHYSSRMLFTRLNCICFIFETVSVSSLIRTYNWQGHLVEILFKVSICVW